MKKRLKHLSKPMISLLLALMMIVSTVMVGFITTTAAFVEPDDSVGAKVDADGAVGWSSNDKFHYSLNSATSWDDVDLSTGSGELTINTANSTLKFGFKLGSDWYAKSSSQNNPDYTNSNATYTAQKGDKISDYSLSGLPVGTYKIELVSQSGNDLTFKFYKKPNPVCSSLSIYASKNNLSSETDTFTLTATASGLAATPVTYKIYRTGTTDPIATFSNTSSTSVTTTALTQSNATTATYYATVEKSGYDKKTSGNVTVNNSYAVVTQDIYLYGDGFGTDRWNGDLSQLTKLNYDRSTGNYYLSYTVASSNKFRIYNASDSSDENHRQPNPNSNVELPADGTLISTKKGWGETRWFTFPSSTVGKTIKIWYNASTYQVWIEVQKKVASSVAAQHHLHLQKGGRHSHSDCHQKGDRDHLYDQRYPHRYRYELYNNGNIPHYR